MPVITFINKMDREGRDTFDLLDEIEQKLALDVSPASWPIGMGRNFLGCYDLLDDQLILLSRSKGDRPAEGENAPVLMTRNWRHNCPQMPSKNCVTASKWRAGYARRCRRKPIWKAI